MYTYLSFSYLSLLSSLPHLPFIFSPQIFTPFVLTAYVFFYSLFFLTPLPFGLFYPFSFSISCNLTYIHEDKSTLIHICMQHAFKLIYIYMYINLHSTSESQTFIFLSMANALIPFIFLCMF